MFDRDVDAEIGRPPEEIHQPEGKDHGKAVLALGLGHVLVNGEKPEARTYQTRWLGSWILGSRNLLTNQGPEVPSAEI